MPGATETEFFERADMLDTKIGQSKKDDPVDVAKAGYEAMMSGDGDVVTGFKNKVQTLWPNSIARRRSRAGQTNKENRNERNSFDARIN
jgi:short-subunit dehydrogenase